MDIFEKLKNTDTLNNVSTIEAGRENKTKVITYIKVEDLIVNPLNFYDTNGKSLEEIKKSMETLLELEKEPVKQPIAITKNNVILSGHTRVKACMELGIKEIPAYVTEDDENDIHALITHNNQRVKTKEEVKEEIQLLNKYYDEKGITKKTTAIAEDLGISKRTVERHLSPKDKKQATPEEKIIKVLEKNIEKIENEELKYQIDELLKKLLDELE